MKKNTPLRPDDPALKAGTADKLNALLASLEPQFNSYSCSVASVATVINAIRRLTGSHQPSRLLAQEELLARVGRHHWHQRVSEPGYRGHHGMPLLEFGEVVADALAVFRIPVHRVDTVAILPQAADLQVRRMRLLDDLLAAAGSVRFFLIAHFTQGEYFGDWYGGHISPVGTYDAARQRVLVLDVDPECPVPYWVSFDRFFRGMVGRSKVIGSLGGGYVRIELKSQRVRES
jgi:hypothetical protein